MTRETLQKKGWKAEIISGFQIWFASNAVSEDVRSIYLLGQPVAFTEDSLRLIFQNIAESFPEPRALSVTIMSDPKQLQERMDGPSIPIESSLESSVVQAEHANWNQSDEAMGYFEARYVRSSDADEEYFWYTSNPLSSKETKVMLRSRPSKTYTGDPDSDLLVASEKGDVARVRKLLADGANVNAQDRHGSSALMKAALQCHVSVVYTLLQKGADVNQSDENGWTVLMSAASGGSPDIVARLLDEGANVNAQERHGNTALLVAVSHTEESFERGRSLALINVKALLSRGADANAVGYRGETALIIAAARGEVEMVESLLEGRADPNIRDQSGLTALRAARRQKQTDVVRLLITAGARD